MTHSRNLFPIAACLLVAACGGGGGGGGPTVPTLLDPTSDASAPLTTLIAGSGGAASSDSTFNRGADRITVNGLPGTINAARDTVTFDDGGTAAILSGATEFAAYIEAVPTGSAPFIGIIGLPTASSDLPGGFVDYATPDAARVIIISDQSLFELTGSAFATVNFNGGLVDLTFDNLDGTVSTLGNPSAPATDVARIEINDAALTGTTFSGGEATFTSTVIGKTLSGSETVTTAGGLFGPGADEIAGTVYIDDAALRDLTIEGYFIAD